MTKRTKKGALNRLGTSFFFKKKVNFPENNKKLKQYEIFFWIATEILNGFRAE